MKLLKYIKASLISIFLIAVPSHATTNYDRCDVEYKINEIVTICSEKPLSSNQKDALKKKYVIASKLFPKFISKHGYEWNGASISLTIYVLSKKTLNNRDLFSRPANQELLGRYKDWDGRLYTYYEALLFENTDFVHELAHYFNNNIPITDDEENENIATRFERYYLENS